MIHKLKLFLLLLLFTFLFTACGETEACDEHKDKNEDGICDVCEEEIEADDGSGDGDDDGEPEGVALISEGELSFAFVTSKLPSSVKMTLDEIAEELYEFASEPEIFTLGSEGDADVYIYVGIELGEIFDGYTLGKEGYTIRLKGENIIISAGSEEKLSEALEAFREDVLGEWDNESDLYFTEEMEVTKETRYRTEISVGDTPIFEYSVVTGDDLLLKSIATELVDTLYSRVGARLPVVTECDGPKIIIRHEKSVSGGGFRAYEKDGDVIIECAYKNRFEESVEKFLADNIKPGELDWGKLDYSLSVNTVYYEEFGAVGDGKTDDFEAIKAAHDFANEGGQSVKAKSGATYYIKNMTRNSITVKTNTDFAGASFIIDDTEVSKKFGNGIADKDIFTIASDYSALSLDSSNEAIKKLNENEIAIERDKVTKLDLDLGYPALLEVCNNKLRQYIRYGSNANLGQAQHELVVIDKDGNIDEKTPFLFDFKEVTSITVYRIDDEPIEVKNGKFKTLATKVQDTSGAYIRRGLCISRANTVISNIEHTVEGEIPKNKIVDGVAFYANGYNGFYYIINTSNVEFRDCLATAHVNYNSSYDINMTLVNDVRFINVKQTEENYNDSALWWIMGSNFCKNLYYEDCYLTRFDAHCGVYNATIKNSTIASLRLTGGGDFIIENSTVKAKSYGGDTFIMLREDYGSTWRGNIYIKNCVFDSVYDNVTRETVSVIYGEWVNHAFGYQTYLPNLYIDNLTFAEKLGVKKVNLFKILNKDEEFKNVTNFSLTGFSGKENKNVYVAPETVSVKNCDTGISFALDNTDFYKKTKRE